MNAYKHTPMTLKDLKSIDYTGAKPIDYWIQSPYGDIDPEFIKVPKSMSQLRAAIFKGIATKHLRTNFSCLREEPGNFKNEQRSISLVGTINIPTTRVQPLISISVGPRIMK